MSGRRGRREGHPRPTAAAVEAAAVAVLVAIAAGSALCSLIGVG